MIKANKQFLLLLLIFASIFLFPEVVADQCDRCMDLQRKSRKKKNCPRKCKRLQKKKRFELDSNCGNACCIEVCKRTKEACVNVGICESPTACLYPEPVYPDDFDPDLISTVMINGSLTSIPCSVFLQTKLQNLDLRVNQISLISTEIGRLTTLLELRLYTNQISLIPTEMGLLARLQFLNLKNNQISLIPTEMWLLARLQFLNLKNNQISLISTEMGSLASLKYLDLSFNQLSMIPTEIGMMTNLQSLFFEHKSDFIDSYRDRDVDEFGITHFV